MIRRRAAGLDFGTTNSVAALTDPAGGEPRLILFDESDGGNEIFPLSVVLLAR